MTAEASVVKMIGESFSGEDSSADDKSDIFDFDAAFQTKVAAFACRDDEFMRRVGHLIKPEYFENIGEAAIVNAAVRHFQKYHSVPDAVTLNLRISDDAKAGIIRKDIFPILSLASKNIKQNALQNREFVEDRVAEFARHQAVGKAILKSVDLLEKKKFFEIEESLRAAIDVGVSEDGDDYDYFEKADEREGHRADAASGKLPPKGITTGVPKLDDLLYHRGWGRKELTTIMGGAKAGKTTALINFAKAASLAGKNVLYVSLEVGINIISDRLDASISETIMDDLVLRMKEVKEKVEEVRLNAGKLQIREFASGTMTGNILRTVIEKFKTPGRNSDGSERSPIKFDLVVVDYADLMAPNHRTNDSIENSKSVYVDLRAIAFEENLAMLTATQTNREGYKAIVAKAEHVAEDFNKVRTVDLMISINKTEEEARDGIARLFFAASRNQRSGFTVVIKQRLEMMRFIESVLRVE
jgi:replicative DNA helicase